MSRENLQGKMCREKEGTTSMLNGAVILIRAKTKALEWITWKASVTSNRLLVDGLRAEARLGKERSK